jgi:hypothetical protein
MINGAMKTLAVFAAGYLLDAAIEAVHVYLTGQEPSALFLWLLAWLLT